MISTTALWKVGILLISFIAGLTFFYVIGQQHKQTKKQLIEEIMSLTINFIIFIWLGKIVLHFPKFIKDPFAILAYPSNAQAFYVATVLMAVQILYQKWKQKKPFQEVFHAFIPIFLASSFFYEFLQVVIEKNQANVTYLVLLFILLLFYMLGYGKVKIERMTQFISIALLISLSVLVFINKITLFQYRLSAVYYVILLFILLLINVYDKKKKV